MAMFGEELLSAADVPAISPRALPWLTVEQMREVDRLMVEGFQISLVRMMENAGSCLAELARRMLSDTLCRLTRRGVRAARSEGRRSTRQPRAGRRSKAIVGTMRTFRALEGTRMTLVRCSLRGQSRSWA